MLSADQGPTCSRDAVHVFHGAVDGVACVVDDGAADVDDSWVDCNGDADDDKDDNIVLAQ